MIKKLALSSMALLTLTPVIASVSPQKSVSASAQKVTKLSDSNSLLTRLSISNEAFTDEFPYVLCNFPLYKNDGHLKVEGKLYAPDLHFVPGDTIRVNLVGVHYGVYYLGKLIKNGDIIKTPKDASDIKFEHKYSNVITTVKLKSYNPNSLPH
ncbi:hypothetical protein [Lactococcus lactis]|uniref:hypothetical protein n=1 Tax=Lactococcus lactis TaxID=1358 RepID=UPI001912C8CA|nr:hypothetical protein [Lactococcus lactis]WDA67578.1 hypothetical protein IL310_01570 [Lactococcus lactis]